MTRTMILQNAQVACKSDTKQNNVQLLSSKLKQRMLITINRKVHQSDVPPAKVFVNNAHCILTFSFSFWCRGQCREYMMNELLN